MAKTNIEDIVIDEVPQNEILKEGKLEIMTLRKQWLIFPYKYVITEKGIWLRNPKKLIGKQRSVFMPYEMFISYEVANDDDLTFCLFHQEGDRIPNRVCFDDLDGAIAIIDEYLAKKGEEGEEEENEGNIG